MRQVRFHPVAALLLVLLAIAGLAPDASAATPFATEVIDGLPGGGEFISLALDRDDQPCLSFIHWSLGVGTLRYATRSGGAWTMVTVDSAAGTYSSLELDASGNPHISYQEYSRRDLRYARRSGGAWIIETVDTTGVVGDYSSLALDALGNPRICDFYTFTEDLRYHSKSGSVWTHEIVDSAGSVGPQASLALDPSGIPAVSYWDASGGNLKFASRTGGVWTSTVVVPASYFGGSTSLAIDTAGNPHISYLDGNDKLRYARRLGSTWLIETVETWVGSGGYYTSLALDSHGNPHIAYQADGDLRYATKSNGQWIIETPGPDTDSGYHCSIALDDHDHPRIAHLEVDTGLKVLDAGVRLISPAGGERWAAGSTQTVRWTGLGAVGISLSQDGGATWSTLVPHAGGESAAIHVPAWNTTQARLRLTLLADPGWISESPAVFAIAPDLVSPWWMETADAGADQGYWTSLAIDETGGAHVSYYELPGFINPGLRYARRTGGTWVTETVDTVGNAGEFNSLALDGQGVPSVSYFGNAQLRYATRAGGAWTKEVVDPLGGRSTSLALDAAGAPHVSYETVFTGDLQYARKSGGSWIIESVDATGVVGRYSSLTLDADGAPRIAYQDVTNGNLKFATRTVSGWTTEAVDTTGNTGFWVSMELDSRDEPCVSYQDITRGDLRFARRSGGTWTVETVDAAGLVGTGTSLALDAGDNPVIGYYDETSTALKFARKSGGSWIIETLDNTGSTGRYPSLVLDASANARVTYQDGGALRLKYASAAIEIAEPAAGVIWPVGGARTIRWDGTGPVDLSLSVDGGHSWQPVASGLAGGTCRLIVPHAPSRFARYRLERDLPFSVAETPLFTIQASVSLLAFTAQARAGGGADLAWNTDPGPADLAAYRLERGESNGTYRTLATIPGETAYHDPSGGPGAQYRLHAVNGLGEELLLGEIVLAPAAALAAWPLPYRGGDLTVTMAGGVTAPGASVDLAVFDVAGRRVKTLLRGDLPAGQPSLRWDGRDEAGAPLAGGVYFLRSAGGDETHTLKLVILR